MSLLALALLGPLACNRPEPEAVPDAPEEHLPPGPKASGLPQAADVLRFMPASAGLGLAMPSIAGTHGDALALARRLTPAGVDTAQWEPAAAEEAARFLGVEPGPDMAAVLDTGGVDADRAMAFFVDLTPVEAELEAAGALMPGAIRTMTGGEDADSSAGEDSRRDLANIMAKASFAMLIPCHDTASAEALAGRLLPGSRGFTNPVVTDTADGVRISAYETPSQAAWFALGDWLVTGNSATFLEDIADAMIRPGEAHYGTDTCPVMTDGETALLIRPDVFMRQADILIHGMASADAGIAMAARSLLGVPASTDVADSPDAVHPKVMTLRADATGLRFTSRVNGVEFPGLLERAGKPGPMLYPSVLPDSSVMTVAWQLTPEAQNHAGGQLDAAIANAEDSPETRQAVGVARMAAGMFGRESAVAVYGVRDGVPQLAGIIDLFKADMARNLILLAGHPLQPTGRHGETDLHTSLPIPIGFLGGREALFHYAFPGDRIVFAGDAETLVAMLDRLHLSSESGEGDPMYALVRVDGEAVDTVARPMIEPFGASGLGALPYLDQARQTIDRIELVSEWQEPWLLSQLELRLLPE